MYLLNCGHFDKLPINYLKARLTIIEETAVPGHEDDEGPVLGLVLAPLYLGLQVAAALE